MSPNAGFILTEKIAPRLKAAIPHIKTVGAEDAEELFQDAIAVAAKMLHDLEQRGKEVTPGNVAYYVILHMKSGRRSHSAGRTDAMGSGTALDGKSSVLSFEEPVGFDMELGEPVTLGELIAGHCEDPSVTAARNIDWEDFLDTHDSRYSRIAEGAVQGKTMKDIGKTLGYCPTYIGQLRVKMADEVREEMGADVLQEVCRKPQWQGSIQVEHEKAACRAYRRNR